MKIIGKTTDGYIAEFSDHEVARLTGHYSMSEDGAPRKLAPGDLITIDAMWDRLWRLSAVKRELGEAAKRLRQCADATEEVCPIILAGQEG